MNFHLIIQKINIEYKTVESFYKLLIALPEDKQQIVLDNIYTKTI